MFSRRRRKKFGEAEIAGQPPKIQVLKKFGLGV
jgi:hypothetical protein